MSYAEEVLRDKPERYYQLGSDPTSPLLAHPDSFSVESSIYLLGARYRRHHVWSFDGVKLAYYQNGTLKRTHGKEAAARLKRLFGPKLAATGEAGNG